MFSDVFGKIIAIPGVSTQHKRDAACQAVCVFVKTLQLALSPGVQR